MLEEIKIKIYSLYVKKGSIHTCLYISVGCKKTKNCEREYATSQMNWQNNLNKNKPQQQRVYWDMWERSDAAAWSKPKNWTENAQQQCLVSLKTKYGVKCRDN